MLEAEIEQIKKNIEAQQQELTEHRNELKRMFASTRDSEDAIANWSSILELTDDADSCAYATLLHKNYPLPSFSVFGSWRSRV